MDTYPTPSADYCSDLVRKYDEDRWLAAQYAGDADTRKLIALYAFHIELRRIPGVVSEPPLGEIRLQWYRDTFEEIRNDKRPRAHPVVEEIAAAGLAAHEFHELIESAINAAARPLYGAGFTDIDDLAGWLSALEGAFDCLAVKLLGGDGALAAAAQKVGAAFALAREGKHFAPALGDDAARMACALMDQEKAVLSSAPANAAPGLAHLCLMTLYLKDKPFLFPIRKRLRLFSAVAFGRF